jgi:hypothetical protein
MSGCANDLRSWDAWHTVHQPFELAWWKERLPDHLASPGFEESWAEVKAFINPQGLVLDIGCGPRPPFAPCFVIEPLAVEYRSITPTEWWHDVVVRAHPAEYLAGDLMFSVNTIICWNCLDHTIGWKKILDNMLVYGTRDARYAVATDFYAPFVGHPGFDRDEFMSEIKKRFKIIEQREPLGRALALLMKR